MKDIFPERLKNARLLSKLSLRDLATATGNLISHNAIKKYEDGTMYPDGKVLAALAKALGVKTDYFLRPKKVTLGTVEFRKKSSLPVKEIHSIKQSITDYLERYWEIESLSGITEAFTVPAKVNLGYTAQEIEKSALALREAWNLGLDPIPNVTAMLEERGIRVMKIDADDKFHGLCGWVNNIPVIVVNSKDTVEKQRFTALHELAHLLLTFKNFETGDQLNNKEVEKACHNFAGAVLLPNARNVLGTARHTISLGELATIKEQYGISVQAIMKRAALLEIIDPYYYRSFCIKIAGNRKEENLGNYRGSEQPYRFKQLLYRLVSEELISESKGANLAGKSLASFRKDFNFA